MNILTFDIEEWFQIIYTSDTHNENRWSSFESRIEANVHRILLFLSTQSLPATFFVMGWIAKRYPNLCKSIHNAGYRIGFHSMDHQALDKFTPDSFRKDIRTGKDIIENITGQQVTYYRAPFFSLNSATRWAIPILMEEGFTVDSSVFPSPLYHAGKRSIFYNKPFRIIHDGKTLLEFPVNTYNLGGYPFVFSGGGFFRMLPYFMIKYMTQRSNYVLTYFHPRDFDPAQPKPNELSLFRQMGSYTGLRGALHKFEKWTKEFSFIDMDTALNEIDWDRTPTVNLSDL